MKAILMETTPAPTEPIKIPLSEKFSSSTIGQKQFGCSADSGVITRKTSSQSLHICSTSGSLSLRPPRCNHLKLPYKLLSQDSGIESVTDGHCGSEGDLKCQTTRSSTVSSSTESLGTSASSGNSSTKISECISSSLPVDTELLPPVKEGYVMGENTIDVPETVVGPSKQTIKSKTNPIIAAVAVGDRIDEVILEDDDTKLESQSAFSKEKIAALTIASAPIKDGYQKGDDIDLYFPIFKNVDEPMIDGKMINKKDGLQDTMYYLDEFGSPKLREKYARKERLREIKRQKSNANANKKTKKDGKTTKVPNVETAGVVTMSEEKELNADEKQQINCDNRHISESSCKSLPMYESGGETEKDDECNSERMTTSTTPSCVSWTKVFTKFRNILGKCATGMTFHLFYEWAKVRCKSYTIEKQVRLSNI